MSADLSCCVIWSVPRSLIPFFFFTPTATTEIYTLSLHDALPICRRPPLPGPLLQWTRREERGAVVENHLGSRDKRSEEHTSELQSRLHLVCRLLLEKKKNKKTKIIRRSTKYWKRTAHFSLSSSVS